MYGGTGAGDAAPTISCPRAIRQAGSDAEWAASSCEAGSRHHWLGNLHRSRLIARGKMGEWRDNFPDGRALSCETCVISDARLPEYDTPLGLVCEPVSPSVDRRRGGKRRYPSPCKEQSSKHGGRESGCLSTWGSQHSSCASQAALSGSQWNAGGNDAGTTQACRAQPSSGGDPTLAGKDW